MKKDITLGSNMKLRVSNQLVTGDKSNINQQGSADVNGLVYSSSDKCWYYYTNGVVNKTYKGLAMANGKWWYVENGTINFTYTGMAYGNGKWY